MMREMTHAEGQSLLQAALDNELSASEAMRFEAHLAECPDCAADYARLSALGAAIREGATRYGAPAELRAMLMEKLAPAPVPPPPNLPHRGGGTRRAKALSLDGRGLGDGGSLAVSRNTGTIVPFPNRKSWLRPAAGGFTVGAALATGLALMITTRATDDAVADGIVTAHIRALQPGHLTDVQVSDRHQVKPWFDGRIDFAPPVLELTAQGFDLVGGRLDYIEGREAAVIVYRRNLHLIDLFVTRAAGDRSGPATVPSGRTTTSGYNVEHWTTAGQDYWAVSDLNAAELADFAKAWQAGR